MYKVYEIKQRVFESNDREADGLRKELKEKQIFLLIEDLFQHIHQITL